MAGDPPENSEWALNRKRDYVDASVFGDINRQYLVSGSGSYSLNDVRRMLGTWDPPVATPTSTGYRQQRGDFDYIAALEMYWDDPVACAIIERMRGLEWWK